MASLTLKGIPDELLEALRDIAEAERRSLTQEAIRMLEESVAARTNEAALSSAAKRQADAWRQLAGRWKSDRSDDEEVADIYDARTPGREVDW